MVLPVFFILNAGRIIQIAVGAGTALARFVAKKSKNNRHHPFNRSNIFRYSVVCYI